MYARLKAKPNIIGDVQRRSSNKVTVQLHDTQKTVTWNIEMVEFIEHGSFNPDSANFIEGGKVIGYI